MARYATSEPMYQCMTGDCKTRFSDREGIKVTVRGQDTLTHIGCPRCKHIWVVGGHAVQIRHEYKSHRDIDGGFWVNNTET